MKKIFLTSILTLCMACPAMANIDKDASTATCDNATIGTTTGPANLQADWTANTINLDFYSNDTKVGTGTCTYDGTITLPSTPEVPTGYIFGGWKVRAAAVFDLSALAEYINTKGTSVYSYGSNACKYYTGTGTSDVDCPSDIHISEWKTEFDYGVVYGTSKCSAKIGDNQSWKWDGNSSAWTATNNEIISANSGDYCWCKVIKINVNDTMENTDAPLWAFAQDMTGYCDETSCAYRCASNAFSYTNFRKGLYGITE